MATQKTLQYLAAAAALLLCFLPALVAHAGDETPDEVALQNGGLVRGTIIVVDPGEKVVIQVPGEDHARTIPWSEVSDVQRGEDLDSEEVETDSEASDIVPGKGVVSVRIESADAAPMSLTEHMKTGAVVTPYGTIIGIDSRAICSAPCDQAIDARHQKLYTIDGEGFPSSELFSLAQYEGDVTMRVETGSYGLGTGGTAMASIGVIGLLTGAVFLPLGVALNESNDPSGVSTGADMRDIGIGTLVGGAVSLTAGIVMIAQSGTDVIIEPRSESTARLSPRPARWWRGEF